MTWLCACGPRSNFRIAKAAKKADRQRSLIHDIEKASGHRYIYTDTTYASTGNGITIQNSFRKGGPMEPETPYIDTTGKQYFFTTSWTRVINGTNNSLELMINFPADSFPLSSPSGSYLKLFIPTETMTIDKLPLFSYGLTGMKFFVEANWNKATSLHRTIKPNDELIFYVVGLAYKTVGPSRSAIILKGKDLIYRTNMGPHGMLEIPCGDVNNENRNDD